MRLHGVLILVLGLGACATPPTLEELEFQALQSGDWSAVERREKAMARREASRVVACAGDAVQFCEERGRSRDCRCVSRREIDRYFGRY